MLKYRLTRLKVEGTVVCLHVLRVSRVLRI